MKTLQNKCKNNYEDKCETSTKNIKNREKWVDYTKAFACILVVLGHLLQGLKKASIEWDYNLYKYIDTFIYLFHMPLFMCLSGYLYNKTTKIYNFKDYIKFIKKKVINLGVPYIFFYMLYIGINMFFSNSVNTKYGTKEILQIFTNPIAPFWFLYALFFIFLLIPIIEKICKNNKNIVLLFTTVIYIIHIKFKTNIYAIEVFMQYAFYFYLGVIINDKIKSKVNKSNSLVNIVVYILLATSYYFFSKYIVNNIVSKMFSTIIAIIGIFASIKIFSDLEYKLLKNRVWNIISNYNFEIYLLHTIFSAGIRIILIKLNIYDFYIHFILGLLIGIYGPIFIGWIAKKNIYLNFVFFPAKTIQAVKENK